MGLGLNGVGSKSHGLILWENDARCLGIILQKMIWPTEAQKIAKFVVGVALSPPLTTRYLVESQIRYIHIHIHIGLGWAPGPLGPRAPLGPWPSWAHLGPGPTWALAHLGPGPTWAPGPLGPRPIFIVNIKSDIIHIWDWPWARGIPKFNISDISDDQCRGSYDGVILRAQNFLVQAPPAV